MAKGIKSGSQLAKFNFRRSAESTLVIGQRSNQRTKSKSYDGQVTSKHIYKRILWTSNDEHTNMQENKEQQKLREVSRNTSYDMWI